MSAGVSRETVSPVPESPPTPVSRETGAAAPPPSALAALILLPIRAYRRFLSPAVSPRCRYYPSCSTYAEAAIRELGAVRGSIVAAWRILRCNPLSNGGLDPLSDRRLFRADEPRAHTCNGEVDPA